MNKKCIKCGEIKPLEEFFNQPRSKDGKAGTCKVCVKAAKDKLRRKRLYRYAC